MGSLFGEIVHPSSRAFWIEDEDDENIDVLSIPEFTLEWADASKIPTKIKTLILVETNLIIDFTKEYVIKNSEEICQIKSQSKIPSKIYKFSNDLFICTVSPDVDQTSAAEFVTSIAQVLNKGENIMAVTCTHQSQLKSAEEINSPAFLRSLSTKTSKYSLAIPVLKQPNIVSGVAAGVVSFAEIMDLPATLVILYLDGFELDSESATPLSSLFSGIINQKLPTFTSSGHTFINTGNLYL